MIPGQVLLGFTYFATALAVAALIGAVVNRVRTNVLDERNERFLLRLREIFLELNSNDDARKRRAWGRLDALLTLPNTERILTNLWMLHPDNQAAVVKRVREKGILVHFLGQLSSRNKWKRAKAVKILATVQSEETIRALVSAIHDPDPDIRMFAARALSRIKDPTAEKALIAMLGLHEETFSSQLAAMFIEMGVKASPLLVEKLTDPNPRARRWAAEILGEIASPTAAPRLLELLRDVDADVRAAAVRALGRLRLDQSKRAIFPLAKDEAWFVRAHAVSALGELGGDDVIEPLLAALTDRSWWVRKSAIEALVRMDEGATEAVRAILKSPDRFARDSAVEILERHGVPEMEILDALAKGAAS